MGLKLPGGGGFPGSFDDAGQALRYLAGLFPLTRQNIGNDAVGPDQIDGTWTTWTPTWTNLTVGSGTQTAKYLDLGGIVFFKLGWVFGAGSAVGTNPSVTSPVTTVAPPGVASIPVLGHARFYDTSAAIRYDGTVNQASTTSFFPLAMNAGTAAVQQTVLTALVPFTWATGDELHLQGWVELP